MGAGSDIKPLSQPKASSTGCLVVFFGIFLLAGLAVLFVTLVLPVYRVVRSSGWTPTPCTIVSSQVRSQSGGEGTTYRADIRFLYVVGNRTYESDRCSPFSASTSDSTGAGAFVRKYRPRSQSTCYVNPNDPSQAILSRELPMRTMLIGLIPMVFVLVGGGGIYFIRRAARAPATALGKSAVPNPSGPLRAKQGPVTRFCVILAIALFWNGIISFFVVEVVRSYQRGRGDACMTAFMIPFVAIGIGLIIGVIYSFLGIFTPRPQVTLSRPSLRPGDWSDVKWRFTGRYDRISRLTIHLEGREEASYRRGTDTVTDRSVFFRQDIVNTVKPYEIASGTGKITIPSPTMHSFASSNNKIVWEIQLHGEIAGWPDTKEQFEVTVLPAQVRR